MVKRPTRSALRKRYGHLHEGAHVRVMFGDRETDATVVENRGNVGMHGRHMLRIQVDADGTAIEYEVPASDVKPVPPAAKSRATPARSRRVAH